MKKAIFTVAMVLSVRCICVAQTEFNTFVSKFKPVTLPINSILQHSAPDSATLNGSQTNVILIRSQSSKAQYVDKTNTLKVDEYFGLYPDGPSGYGCGHSGKDKKWIDSTCYFYNKILPIGRLDLNPQYVSFIIKVVSQESIFYDLWNFTKEGKSLSVICLFYGEKNNGMDDELSLYTIVTSKITATEEIIWHENNRGLETFRTYKLNDDGYFQVIKEEQKGEFEY